MYSPFPLVPFQDSNLGNQIIPIQSITPYINYGDMTKIYDGNTDISSYSGGIIGGNYQYLMFVLDMGYACQPKFMKKYAYNGGGAGVKACNRIVVSGTNNPAVLTKFNSLSEALGERVNLFDSSIDNADIALIPLSKELPLKNNNQKYRYYLVISYNVAEHQSIIEIEMYS